jgi:predicted ATPase
MLLQLEPSALRKPDDYNAPSMLANNGEHLPATLHRLAQKNPENIYQQVTNSLSELIDDVREIKIDTDEKRQLYTLYIKDSNGTWHPAHSLSDGTLRFLALSIIGMDPQAQGLICLEEPENGIHPERVPAMLELLRGMAVDTNEPVDDNNPLRQVIVNTHSPGFVGEVPEDTLLAVENKELAYKGKTQKGIVISAIENTWRQKDQNIQAIKKNVLLSYLQPLSKPEPSRSVIRIIDRYPIDAVQTEMIFKAAEPPGNYGKT